MRRRRLRYRAWHRGTRELDLLLGPFADAHLDRMSESDLDRFERLLALEETDLQAWLLNQAPPPDAADPDLIARIAAHKTLTA
jgi:antitoxin CptB